jgi:uncharacterized protein
MLIDLNKLPKEGKRLQLEFNEVFNNTCFYIKSFNGEIFKEKNEYVLHGELDFEVEEKCDRCLEKFILVINDYIALKLTEELYDNDMIGKPEIQLSEADLDMLFLDNSIVDVNMLILEEAESLRPISKLCVKECKGLCEYCGTNLNIRACDCDKKNDRNFNIGDLINRFNK